MDINFEHVIYPANFSSYGYNDGDRHSLRVECGVDITLRLDSPGVSSLYSSKLQGTKRKKNDDSSATEHTSLALGLGCSPSSSDNSKFSSAINCSISYPKEITDEESSLDVGLKFELHLVCDGTFNPKNQSDATTEATESGPELELSLSTGRADSAITSIYSFPAQHQHSLGTACRLPIDQKIHPKADQNSVDPDIPYLAIQPQQRNNLKTCQLAGCGKGARGASGLCIAHGGGRRCQKDGCQKGAEGRTVYCKAHGGGRRCQYLGCTKSAEGRTEYCIAHGGGHRCSTEGCARAARGKSGLCIRHGGGKRCQRENCTKSAEGYTGLCISHGGGRRCQYPACTKGAQGSTMFCKAHGGGKRCTVLGCMKGAEGSTSFCKGHGGGKRCLFQGGGVCPKSVHGGTQFCVAHGGGKRCAVPECTKSARGRTEFCVRHGGGKRCKFLNCGKSAQGSTEFCKAHGGGKRCSWGQVGSDFGAGDASCDRFARGKTGLCAAHSALLQDCCIHGGETLGHPTSGSLAAFKTENVREDPAAGKTFNVMVGNGPRSFMGRICVESPASMGYVQSSNLFHPELVSGPEGRVHGASLLTFLTSGGGV